jgi:predicted negative regulator of RcsB-dependent stress response
MQDPGLPLLRGNADPTFFLLLCIVAIVGWELWQRRRRR